MTLGGQSLCGLLIKFTWEQQKNQAMNINAIFQDAICNVKKVQFINQKLDIAYF